MVTHQPGGKIPHRKLGQRPVHIIMRLDGSVPKAEIARLKQRRDEALKALYGSPEANIPQAMLAGRKRISGFYHLGIDDALHKLSNGPYHMNDPRIARIVLDCLIWLSENKRWFLYAACIMGNHLHVVVRANEGEHDVELGPIIDSFKTFTSRRANVVLNNTGNAFWSPDYFDRDVRDGKFTKVMWYVLENPVAAGLVDNWTDWEFTYVHP